MTNNNIQTLYMNQFRKYPKLNNLKLKYNNIRRIVPDSGLVLEEMKSFNIRYNMIASISSAVIKSFPNLETFALYHNQIREFPTDLFQYNTKIRRVYLGPNPTTTFNGNFLYNLKS